MPTGNNEVNIWKKERHGRNPDLLENFSEPNLV